MSSPDPPEPQELVSLLRSGEAPLEIRRFAARGLLPLDLEDASRALLSVLNDEDEEVVRLAAATMRATPPDEFAHFIETAQPRTSELDSIVRHCDDSYVLELVIRHPETSDETLERLAREVTGAPQEALVINQVRLIRNPALIDALFENPALTPDVRRRLQEVREEFFDKQDRRRVADAGREVDDALAAEIAAAEALEKEIRTRTAARERIDAELEKSLTTGAAYRRIAVMTVSEKIKLAYSGGKEERRILMGDANKLIGAAVLKSRGLTINEIESFCAMRHLDEEVFRKIASNREWIRKPAVVSALVKNPKVSLGVALPLIKRLGDRDLKAIMRDVNLAEGIRIAARKMVIERRK